MSLAIEDLQKLQRNIDLFQSVMKELFTNAILREVVEGDLTSEQMKCLRFVCCNERVSVGQLAKGLKISYPAATKAISRLEEKDIVFRQKDPLDKRNIYVSLTSKGTKIAKKVQEEKLRRLENLLRLMTAKEIETFTQGIAAPLKVVLNDKKLKQGICLHCGKEHQQDCLVFDPDCFCYL